MSLLLEQEQVILHGVSWQTFQQLLADRGERCGVLLAYDRGTVELRMPSQEHEWIKTTLTQVVEAIAFARDLHYRSLGSTTFGREDLERGFEPEACFYLDHADAVSPDRALDLTVEPPPDLVIEVDISRSSLDKLPIYTTLGVPEIWRYTDGEVELQGLTEGTYRVVDTSQVLPGIQANVLTRLIDEARTATNQTKVVQGCGDCCVSTQLAADHRRHHRPADHRPVSPSSGISQRVSQRQRQVEVEHDPDKRVTSAISNDSLILPKNVVCPRFSPFSPRERAARERW